MKTFIIHHWYRFILASSAFIFSCAFMLYALKSNTVKAGDFKTKYDLSGNNYPENSFYIVAVGKNIYEVSWNSSTGKYQSRVVDTVQ